MSSATTTTTKQETITEGSARVIVPSGDKVFYNHVQNVNRDVSVLVLDEYARQWDLERRARDENKTKGLSGWRRPNVTWSSWGAPSPLPPANPKNEAKSKDEDDEGEGVGVAATNIPKTNANSHFDLDQPLRILEALAATGLRSIRYAKELAPEVPKLITANDLEEAAAASIEANSRLNEPYPPGTSIEATQGDAIDLMMRRRRRNREDLPTFDVIDLDPYGTPSTLLDSAMRAVEDGGMLCVTATDLAVLAGANNMEKCHAKYGSVSIHRPYGHEMAIRIVLSCLEANANRHGRFIVPHLSLKLDFYVRVFVRVYTSAGEVKNSVARLGYVYQSKACDAFHIIPLAEGGASSSSSSSSTSTSRAPARLTLKSSKCEETGADYMIGGPMWVAPLHNLTFVDRLLARLASSSLEPMKLKYAERVGGILAAAREELSDVPLYYTSSSLCKTLHCSSPPLERFQAALVNAGYRVSQSHHEPEAIKTDAPPGVVYDVLRCWIAKHPISEKRLEPDSVAAKILAKQPTLKADFDPPLSVREARRRGNRTTTVQVSSSSSSSATTTTTTMRPRYDPNPESYWGPKSKAHGGNNPSSSSNGPKRGGDGGGGGVGGKRFKTR